MDRDKFLTEAMNIPSYKYSPQQEAFIFSTWQGFGKLWEWAQEQEWWLDIVKLNIFDVETLEHEQGVETNANFHFHVINPDRFANAVYEYLKDR